MTLRAVIVDDEPLAREGLHEFLAAAEDVDVIAECASGEQAISVIAKEHPDLVVLDIQMPGIDGFEVLSHLQAPLPAVIFVTAHDEYALQAFEAHAVDYVLKPVERDRLLRALERARALIAHDQRADLTKRLQALLQTLSQRPTYPTRLAVRDGATVRFVPVADIDWIEAAANYARLHVGANRHVIRETMTALERTLDPERFVRIHRSTIVNVERIREIQPWFKGDYMVILHDGTQLSLTRKYRDRLL